MKKYFKNWFDIVKDKLLLKKLIDVEKCVHILEDIHKLFLKLSESLKDGFYNNL
jgi:hypothetical protein